MADKSTRTKAAKKAVKVKEPARAAEAKPLKKAAPAKQPQKQEAPKKPAPPKKPVKPAKKATTFKLDTPQATQVAVVGCFNAWDALANPMKRDRRGIWTCTVDVEPGQHQYRFVVDGVWWDDPMNTMRCWNEYGTQNCILIVED
jgi:Glycogen recognition site of AMP-activated protein kinase